MTHPAAAATFEEIEQQLDKEKSSEAGGQGSAALQTKLDGAEIPEEYRGKTLAEVLALTDASKRALEISERARKEVEGRVGAPPPPPPPPIEDEFTQEQFETLYKDEPAKAFAKMQEASERRIAKNLESRLVPLIAGTVQSAEAQARQQYAEAFDVFGNEIEQFIKTDLHGDRSRLATAQAWGSLVAYIQGQPAHVERLFEHRKKKSADTDRAAAHARQEAVTGFSGTATARHAPTALPAGSSQLDAVEREIAGEFIRSGVFKNEAEYIKWKGVA